MFRRNLLELVTSPLSKLGIKYIYDLINHELNFKNKNYGITY